LTSIVGSTFNFDYLIKNTSSLPTTSSRVSVFGFNLSADPLSKSASAPFGTVGSGNMPNVGSLDVCFRAGGGGPNCAGGGGGGVELGDDASGTFSLTFAGGTSSFSIDDFAVRYQSLLPVPAGQDGDEGSASGWGTVTTAVPEPATWGMMILGFGIVGGAMRRRQMQYRIA
jgi:hypothetical protein